VNWEQMHKADSTKDRSVLKAKVTQNPVVQHASSGMNPGDRAWL